MGDCKNVYLISRRLLKYEARQFSILDIDLNKRSVDPLVLVEPDSLKRLPFVRDSHLYTLFILQEMVGTSSINVLKLAQDVNQVRR